MTTRPLQDLMRRIRRLERQVEAGTSQPQLAFSSIEDGFVMEYDIDGNPTMQIGQQYDGSHIAAPLIGPIPPAPTGLTFTPAPGGVEVTWNGTFFGDVVAPMDFARVDIAVSTNPAFDAVATPPYASIASPRGGGVFIPLIEGATVYLAAVTRSVAGKVSTPSSTASVVVGSFPAASSDGIAPTQASVLTMFPGVGTLHARWTAITNADPVMYRLHGALGRDPLIDGSDEVAAGVGLTATTVSRVGTATVLSTGSYRFRVTVEDADTAPGATRPASNTVIVSPILVDVDLLTAQVNASITAAQADADAAQAAAAAAQTTADGKIVAYYQTSQPWTNGDATHNGDAGDLWYDTDDGNKPYYYTGAAWATVRDTTISTAQARADAAFAEAVAASTAAGNAQTSANGKNRVWYQAAAPAGTGHAVNDLWFDTDDGNKPYQWSGTAWVAAPFGDAAISNLDAAKITTGFLDVANRLQAGSIVATHLAASTITGDRLAVNAITTRELAVGAIIAAHLTANNVIADAINAVDMTAVTMTGATLQSTALTERGVKIGQVGSVAGIFAYKSTGEVFLKAVPDEGMAMIDALVKATSVTVSEGAGLGGVTEIQRSVGGTPGALRLTAGTTAPKSAPTVVSGHATQQFTNDGLWANRYGWTTDGTYWFTTRLSGTSLYIERWNTDGTLYSSYLHRGGITYPGSCVYGNGYIWILCSISGGWVVDRLNSTTVAYEATFNWTGNDGNDIPAIGYDTEANPITIAQSRATNQLIRIRRYSTSMSLWNTIDTDYSTSGVGDDLAVVLYGTFDLGIARYILARRASTGSFHVQTQTGVAVSAEDWSSAMRQDKVGTHWVAASNKFVGMDATGLMRDYTEIKGDATTRTKWVSNTLANATMETDQSPRSKIVLSARCRLQVTTSLINSGGTNAPDRVKIYVGQGAADPGPTEMWKQNDPAVGAINLSYTSLLTSGTTPPTTNGFTGGTVQQLQIGTGAPFVDGEGTLGSAGITAVRDASPMRAGVVVTTAHVVNTTLSTVVTFSTPFPAGITPRVMATVQSSSSPENYDIAVDNPTNTGFTLKTNRNSGTSALTVAYIAVLDR